VRRREITHATAQDGPKIPLFASLLLCPAPNKTHKSTLDDCPSVGPNQKFPFQPLMITLHVLSIFRLWILYKLCWNSLENGKTIGETGSKLA
jgi:hypothetical protein